MPTKPIQIRIPDDLLERLDEHVALVRGVRNQHIVQAIAEYLDRQKAIYAEILRNLEAGRDGRRKANRPAERG